MRSFRERRPWLVGIVSIVLISIGMGLAFSINRFEGLRGVYSISAELTDAAGLVAGNEVRVAGVRVGRVTGIGLGPRAAIIEMEIEDDIEIPMESRLEVKLKTLLGQKFIDLQFPRPFLTVASNGGDLEDATEGFLSDGDVIPRSQTKIPFEIYQAANEGTAVLEAIDKRSLRRMLAVVGDTIGASKEELRRALVALDDSSRVLGTKSAGISKLIGNLDRVSSTLAASDQDIEGIFQRASEVLEVLASRRQTTSSLLAATNDLSKNIGLLIRTARGSIFTGTWDLNSILLLAEGELGSIESALEQLAVSQRLFAQPLKFGRFVEGNVCAVISEDTCVAHGSPEEPGLPVHGIQPSPSPATAKVAP